MLSNEVLPLAQGFLLMQQNFPSLSSACASLCSPQICSGGLAETPEQIQRDTGGGEGGEVLLQSPKVLALAKLLHNILPSIILCLKILSCTGDRLCNYYFTSMSTFLGFTCLFAVCLPFSVTSKILYGSLFL